MTVQVIEGDARAVLPTLPDESVQCVVTSPPYFGLRDYGVDGQIGLEPTVDAFVAELVSVFREVRRVLRDDGTLWLNLGDSYAANRPYQAVDNKHRDVGNNMAMKVPTGMKPKDLIGVPWMVAFALRADGWYLRSDIIWAKPNPMPESVRDRPTKAHEYLFLLTKQPRYYWDADAVKEDAATAGQAIKMADGWDTSEGGHGTFHRNGREKGASNGAVQGSGRNIRSVWTIATHPFSEAHFATFPPALVEPCIKAGSSEKGACPACGAPWVRVTDRIDAGYDGSRYGERAIEATGGAKTGGTARSTLGSSNGKLTGKHETTGWQPSCPCDAGDPVPCVVLDPFFGAGTVGLVADRLGRDCIGVELNPEYAAMSRKRITGDAPLFAAVS
jgi:DNA modification methylase